MILDRIAIDIFVRKYGTYWIKGKGKQKEECNDYIRNDELENDNQSVNLFGPQHSTSHRNQRLFWFPNFNQEEKTA